MPKDRDDSGSLDAFLELRALYDKFNDISEKIEGDLNRNQGILGQLDGKVSELQSISMNMEKDKEIIDSLNAQINELKAKYNSLEAEANNLKQQVIAKDQQVIEKDTKIASLDAQLEEIKVKIQESQDKIIELQKINEDLKLKEKDLNSEIEKLNENYNSLKVRLRDSGDSVLGTTMELEKLKSDSDEKDQKIKELEEKLGSLLTGDSGVITNKDELINAFKKLMPKLHRSIRLCVPNLNQLEDGGLLPILQEYPSTSVINIAANVNPTDEHIVLNLKEKGATFTQFDKQDRWLLNRDGEEFIIAVEKDDKVVGFFSNEPHLVSMFNSVIMDPFVKGIKI
ncbi:MAG: hypothetical protein ACFFCS_19450 [Candidatus Hodarchaeota archaeon]